MSTRVGIRVVILARSSRTMPIPCLVCSQDVADAPTIINACGHEYHASCLPRARAYNILTCGICQLHPSFQTATGPATGALATRFLQALRLMAP
jgi:hypothetical protein